MTTNPPPAAHPATQAVTTFTGRRLSLVTPLHGGRSHTTLLAYDTTTGAPVVLKTGGDPLKIHHEARALTALAALPSTPCPQLVEASRIRMPHSRPPSQPCLVLRHIPGRHPRTPDDYRALGAALALWHTTPTTTFRAFAISPTDLIRPARSYAATTAPHLTQLLDTLVPLHAHSWAEPVLTHGDAGPANTLVNRGRAVLLDCENSALAHPGLDLGRALFLTDLEEPTDQNPSRIESLLSGYTSHRPLPDRLTQWMSAAGLGIAAWRHAHRARIDVPPPDEALARAEYWVRASPF
ncbi:phosphotransferase family protein [Streptomyces paludis]|uniref:Aminoglycoside phosphotransferase domain-containing protein n=1 Tax=Streptomyces paludis TaxID=2282738 RepID=A0A345HRB7_9ACTN|nr:phosphotransferase [Streptomyces paludis]AXG79241.1 hypothetical protein DVK44_18015 [Streptomyces paludis]